MKCNSCNRKVKDSIESKMKHIIKYHPFALLPRIFSSEESLIQIGAFFGNIAKQAFHKAYGKTIENH